MGRECLDMTEISPYRKEALVHEPSDPHPLDYELHEMLHVALEDWRHRRLNGFGSLESHRLAEEALVDGICALAKKGLAAALGEEERPAQQPVDPHEIDFRQKLADRAHVVGREMAGRVWEGIDAMITAMVYQGHSPENLKMMHSVEWKGGKMREQYWVEVRKEPKT